MAAADQPAQGRPAYAPDLNSVEGLWSSRKAVELANRTTPTFAEALQQAHRGIQRVGGGATSGLWVPAAARACRSQDGASRATAWPAP